MTKRQLARKRNFRYEERERQKLREFLVKYVCDREFDSEFLLTSQLSRWFCRSCSIQAALNSKSDGKF